MDLARLKVSGGFLVSSANPPTPLARIPRDAMEPAQLTVFNPDTAAFLYLKFIPLNQTGQNFVIADAGIVLRPGTGFTWDKPPRASMLVALSTVNNSICSVDGNWSVPEEAQIA